VNRNFGKLQLISSGFMAFSHGTNDAQKAMGIITLALLSGGYIESLTVPLWVIVVCATAMGLGTAMGGWRVIKTLGVQMLKLEPVHGFAAETAATATIIGASALGMPVSTTLMAWIITLPATFFMAWLSCKLMLTFMA
jgi:PiT family inorganic phosphate transporter